MLPAIADAQLLSKKIALAVAEQAKKEGLAKATDIDYKAKIEKRFWVPRYYNYVIRETWDVRRLFIYNSSLSHLTPHASLLCIA